MSVKEVYEAELAARGYQSDPAQLRAVEALDRCAARVGRVQGAALQRLQEADQPARDSARRLHARRRGARQELPDGLLLHGRAAGAQDAAALPRVHARGAPRAGRAAGHGEPAGRTGRAHRQALPADLLRRIPRGRHHRRDDPAPAAGRAVRQRRGLRHHLQLQAGRSLPERPAPRPHPAGHRAAQREARSDQRRQRRRLPPPHHGAGQALPHAAGRRRPTPR